MAASIPSTEGWDAMLADMEATTHRQPWLTIRASVVRAMIREIRDLKEQRDGVGATAGRCVGEMY